MRWFENGKPKNRYVLDVFDGRVVFWGARVEDGGWFLKIKIFS